MQNDSKRRLTGTRLFNPVLWAATTVLWLASFVLAFSRGEEGMLKWMYLALSICGAVISFLNFRDYFHDKKLLAEEFAANGGQELDHCLYCGADLQKEFQYCPQCGNEVPHQ